MNAQRQILVIGLDGATYRVIDPLLERGELPVLQRLFQEGVRGHLTSTMPPNSAPAWTSFLTGVSPGRHRILDFREVDLRRYEIYTGRFVNATAFAGRTILDLLAAHTRGVVAFRVPMTYPVWPLNGILVAGYPTPDRKRAYTYPPDLAEALTPIALHSHDEIARADVREARRNADHEIAIFLQHMGRWLRQNHHDVYMAVTGIPDGFHHRFWKYHDPQHPLHNPDWSEEDKGIIRQYYRRLDEMIGQLLDLVDDSWLVVVMSDHGGGPRPRHLFNTNAWLAAQGWLTPVRGGEGRALHRVAKNVMGWAKEHLPMRLWLVEHMPAGLRRRALAVRQATGLIDWPRTRAYRVPLQFPAEGIEINVRGRQPQGTVAPGAEYEALREEIIAALREVRHPETGARVVTDVWRREEIDPGADDTALPDILFLTDERVACGDDVQATFTDLPLSALERISGDHTMDGMAAFWGAGVRQGAEISLSILDLPPTLVWAAGVPVPEDMDGRVLTDAFTPEYVRAHPVEYGPPLWEEAGDGEALTPEEEAAIHRALAGLGYVEDDAG